MFQKKIDDFRLDGLFHQKMAEVMSNPEKFHWTIFFEHTEPSCSDQKVSENFCVVSRN